MIAPSVLAPKKEMGGANATAHQSSQFHREADRWCSASRAVACFARSSCRLGSKFRLSDQSLRDHQENLRKS